MRGGLPWGVILIMINPIRVFLYYWPHYSNDITGAMASQITSPTIVYATAYSGAGQRKHQSPASLAFVREIHRSPVDSPHKGPVTRQIFPFDDVIMDECKALGSPHRAFAGLILGLHPSNENVVTKQCCRSLAGRKPRISPGFVMWNAWWRHQIETFSALLALCGEFTGHRCIPLTKASDA